MRTRHKKWAKPFIDNHQNIICDKDTTQNNLRLKEILSMDNVCLEIGSGKGGFAISMAKKFPELTFLCVEKVESVAAQFAKLLEASELTNIFIVSDDISALTELFKTNYVSYLFLNHSDPWPKKRHEKRRLTSPGFLNFYKKLLKKDGELIFKTDNDGLFAYTIETLKENGFEVFDETIDYDGLDEFDALTNYESNFRNKGVNIKRLKAKHIGD